MSIGSFEEIVAPLSAENALYATALLERWVREPFAERATDLFEALLGRMELLEPADWNDLVSDAITGLMAGPPLAAHKFQQLQRLMEA